MKSKLFLPLMPVLLAMLFVSCSYEAKAVDVSVSLGGSRPHRTTRVVEYRTADPVYTTWYPETTRSYVYVAPTPTVTYSSGYSTNNYVYTSRDSNYNGWYGNGRSGNSGYYGNRYDSHRSGRDHNHRDRR